MTTDLRDIAAVTALNKMMDQGWFSICTIDNVGRLLGTWCHWFADFQEPQCSEGHGRCSDVRQPRGRKLPLHLRTRNSHGELQRLVAW